MQTADDPCTTPEEGLQALPTCIRAVASKAIHQGATTALVAAQLEFSAMVKVRVVQQAFPPTPEDEDYIDDLFKCVEPAANAILAKVNVDDIFHDRLDR